MRKLILTLLLGTSLLAFAGSKIKDGEGTPLGICLSYMTTNYPDSGWNIQDDSDGQGLKIKNWDCVLPKPTAAQALSNWPSASLWYTNNVVESKSDLSSWKTNSISSDDLQKVFKALVVCINARLPATNKITASELKAEIKTQLKKD